MASPSTSTTSNTDNTLQQTEQVLDFIRGNLQNIESTWGSNSSQYASTRDIMERLWDAHAEKLRKKDGNVIKLDSKSTLDDLLAGMSLGEERAGDVKMS